MKPVKIEKKPGQVNRDSVCFQVWFILYQNQNFTTVVVFKNAKLTDLHNTTVI